MMSAKFWDFLPPPPCPNFHTTSLTNLSYYVCLSKTPLPPSSVDIIIGSPLSNVNNLVTSNPTALGSPYLTSKAPRREENLTAIAKVKKGPRPQKRRDDVRTDLVCTIIEYISI